MCWHPLEGTWDQTGSDIIFTLWIPSVKFQPITVLLNRSPYHKIPKTVPKFHGHPELMNKLTLNKPAIIPNTVSFAWIMYQQPILVKLALWPYIAKINKYGLVGSSLLSYHGLTFNQIWSHMCFSVHSGIVPYLPSGAPRRLSWTIAPTLGTRYPPPEKNTEPDRKWHHTRRTTKPQTWAACILLEYNLVESFFLLHECPNMVWSEVLYFHSKNKLVLKCHVPIFP